MANVANSRLDESLLGTGSIKYKFGLHPGSPDIFIALYEENLDLQSSRAC